MKTLLEKLFNHENLSETEAKILLEKIVNDEANQSQIVAAITCILMRTVSENEIEGFRNALLEQAVIPDLYTRDAIDVCGTGGDGKNTFNISTLTAIVIAGAGYKVIKHGNYGASSHCGSSNLLESIGYNFRCDSDNLNRQLENSNLVFLHAPLFHPCLKKLVPIRQELGVRTFFNFLGPLLNPVQPDYQLSGVFDLRVARIYKSILSRRRKRFAVVHSLDGYDEVSLTSAFSYLSESKEQLIYPEELGLESLDQNDLYGGESISDARQIFETILAGAGTKAQNQVVLVSSALSIQCMDSKLDFDAAYQKAEQSLLCKSALKSITKCIHFSTN